MKLLGRRRRDAREEMRARRRDFYDEMERVEHDRVTLRASRSFRGDRRSDRDMPVRAPAVTPAAMTARGGSRREIHDPDWIIVVAVLALAAVGILMVYSASSIYPSYAASQNSFQMVAPQIGAALMGIAAMVGLANMDYRYLRKVSVILAVVALILLIAVLVPKIGPVRIGTVVNGSARFIRLGPFFEIHPAEVAKIALVIYLSHWLATRGSRIKSLFRGTVPYWIIIVPFVILVAREPDLGTSAVILLVCLTLFFVAGANLLHLAVAMAGGVIGGALLLLAAGDYPLHRIQVFLDPWSDPQNGGYQAIRGLQALAAGGMFGTGLGNDTIPLPNDFNDYIFSVIAQELGFVGGVVVIALFVALAWAGVRTATRAPDTFGGLLAAGVTAWLSVQAFINIAVVLALLPVTGITLPFISQGGSSLVVSFAGVGILLSVSRETVEGGWVNASADRGRGYGRTYLPGSRRRPIAAGSTGDD